MPTAGEILAASLAAHGIDRVFCVPGESFLGLLDAFYDQPAIDLVTCRHEAGAGFMAVADSRLSGQPGVLCVSRGPGASNAAIAVHAAQQDGAPLLVIVGQVPRADLRRDAFQEIDYAQMFGRIAKWTCEVIDPAQIGESVLRAMQVATSGVPGAVVLAVPEDILTAQSNAKPALPQSRVSSGPSAEASRRLVAWLDDARRPLIVAGNGFDAPGGREALLAFSEQWDLPVAVSFRRHDLFPNDHPNYVGELGLANSSQQMSVFRRADLLLCLGTRLGDATTQGYTFPQPVRPEMRLVHVHADSSLLGRHFRSDLSIACSPVDLLNDLGRSSEAGGDRKDWIRELRAVKAQGCLQPARDAPDGIPFEFVVRTVAESLPRDAIVAVDAGTFAAPIYRSVPFTPPQRLLAPISGAMGYGIPAAVAAALRHPDRPIFCFVGDGGLLMTCAELAVAADRGLQIKVIVSENNSYGSIRVHQERDYPGRTVGTSLYNPDLAALGRAFGFAVTCLQSVNQFDALSAAIHAEGPQFILVRSSLSAVLPIVSKQLAAAEPDA